MTRWNEALTEIRAAIEQLAEVSAAQHDNARLSVSSHLRGNFAVIADAKGLRTIARDCKSSLFRGGMGSFQDVSNQEMADVVSHLYATLTKASRAF